MHLSYQQGPKLQYQRVAYPTRYLEAPVLGTLWKGIGMPPTQQRIDPNRDSTVPLPGPCALIMLSDTIHVYHALVLPLLYYFFHDWRMITQADMPCCHCVRRGHLGDACWRLSARSRAIGHDIVQRLPT